MTGLHCVIIKIVVQIPRKTFRAIMARETSVAAVSPASNATNARPNSYAVPAPRDVRSFASSSTRLPVSSGSSPAVEKWAVIRLPLRTPASSKSRGAAQIAAIGFPSASNAWIRAMISGFFLSVVTAAPPSRNSASNSSPEIFFNKTSAVTRIPHFPVTSIAETPAVTT